MTDAQKPDSTGELELQARGVVCACYESTNHGKHAEWCDRQTAEILSLIRQRDQEHLPMGYSEWLKHGEKFGYTKFFTDQQRERLLEAVGEAEPAAESAEYQRVMALPKPLRKELNYLAFMQPVPVPTFYHNIAVAGERIQAIYRGKSHE